MKWWKERKRRKERKERKKKKKNLFPGFSCGRVEDAAVEKEEKEEPRLPLESHLPLPLPVPLHDGFAPDERWDEREYDGLGF